MNLLLFGPELYYLGLALVFFCLSLRGAPRVKTDYRIALGLAALGVLLTACCLWQQGYLFFKAYRVDLFSQIFKFALALGLFLVLTISHNLAGIEARQQAEFYLFLTTTIIGMMLLVSAVELLTIYVALELSSYSLYILVPLRRGDGIDVEAGIKYLFIGAVSSGFMLFGLSYIFGATGTTYLADLAPRLAQLTQSPIGLIGLLLAMAGFFFKLSVFPFHFWAPDVYQGAANQVAAFMATASKAAAVALLLRFAALGAGYGYGFTQALMILSIASMTLGNLVAHLSRRTSSACWPTPPSPTPVTSSRDFDPEGGRLHRRGYYALAYLVMNFTVFMVLSEVAGDGRDLKIVELGGLYRRSPPAQHEPDPGDLRPGGGAAFHRLHRQAAALHLGHEFGLLLAGADRAVNGTVSLYYYLGCSTPPISRTIPDWGRLS